MHPVLRGLFDTMLENTYQLQGKPIAEKDCNVFRRAIVENDVLHQRLRCCKKLC